MSNHTNAKFGTAILITILLCGTAIYIARIVADKLPASSAATTIQITNMATTPAAAKVTVSRDGKVQVEKVVR